MIDTDRLVLPGAVAGVAVTLRSLARSSSLVPGGEALYDAVMTAVSLAITAGRPPPILGDGALWLFYGGLFYRTLPELIPSDLGVVRSDRGLIALLSVLSVGFGVVFFAPIVSALLGIAVIADPAGIPGDRVAGLLGGVLPATLLGSLVVVSGYLWLRFDDPLDSDAELYEVLVVLAGPSIPQRATAYRTGGAWARRTGRALGYLTIGSVFTATVFVLGGLTVILNGFSPVPELLVIVAAASARLPGSIPVSVGMDIEARTQRTVTAYLQNQKAQMALPLVLLGVFFSLGTTVLGLSHLRRQVSSRRIQRWLAAGDPGMVASAQFRVDLAWVGTAVVLLTAGVLLFWYWIRLVQRLPAFTRAWAKTNERPPSVTRPPWSVVVPMGLVCWGLLVPTTVTLFDPELYRPVHQLVGVTWPLGLLVGGSWIRVTRRAEPQPAATDRGTIPLAVWLTVVPFVAFPQTPVSGRVEVLLVVGFLTLQYVLPDLRQSGVFDAQGDLAAPVARIAVPGLALIALLVFVVRPIPWLLVGIVVVLAVAALLVEFYRTRRLS